ncbi:MAG: hypothetical protein ACRD9S_07430 [Pyrinomonadaceae bacterium]
MKRISCPFCEINVLDMNEPRVAARAKQLDIHLVPAIVIDGQFAECCAAGTVDEQALRAAGAGMPLQ